MKLLLLCIHWIAFLSPFWRYNLRFELQKFAYNVIGMISFLIKFASLIFFLVYIHIFQTSEVLIKCSLKIIPLYFNSPALLVSSYDYVKCIYVASQVPDILFISFPILFLCYPSDWITILLLYLLFLTWFSITSSLIFSFSKWFFFTIFYFVSFTTLVFFFFFFFNL